MAVANNEPNNLETLENQLRELSHDDRVLTIIQDFADRLGKTKDRQKVFGAEGVLVRQPIEYGDMLARGLIRDDEDAFALLQGDIVSSDAGYFLGDGRKCLSCHL